MHTRQGPIRTFLILARYCSRTVYEEQLERLRDSNMWWPGNWVRLFRAWTSYTRVGVKLSLYEWYLSLRTFFGLQTITP